MKMAVTIFSKILPFLTIWFLAFRNVSAFQSYGIRNNYMSFVKPTKSQSYTTHLNSLESTMETKDTPSEAKFDVDDVQGKVILFDGICNFCNTWVDILLRIDINKQFRFTPLQSDIGKSLLVSIGKEADDISSVILIDRDNKSKDLNYYDKSACVLKVVEELGPLAGIFTKATTAILPKQSRDSFYDLVAENRYNFLGKRDTCRCSDPQYADRFL